MAGGNVRSSRNAMVQKKRVRGKRLAPFVQARLSAVFHRMQGFVILLYNMACNNSIKIVLAEPLSTSYAKRL